MNNAFACIELLKVDEQAIFESAKKKIKKSGFHLLGLQMKGEIYYGSKETVSSLIFCRADKTLIIKKIYTDLNRCDNTNQ